MALFWLRLLILCSLSFALQAQTFPSKPVHLVVPYPPGGITDILARTIAQRVSVLWGNETMIVDNRAGASGNLGVAYVAKAAPDGYTIVFGNASTHAINASLFKQLPFDPIKDFEPVTNVASVSNVLLVGPGFPGKTVADLIALAKAQPGKLTFASNSIGSSNHLSGELLKSMAKVDLLHVPYKGATAAQTDLIGGRITMMFDNMTTAVPQVRSGKLRALAVTSENRSPALPDVPTMVESGLPGFVVTPWWGVFAPAGTPRPVIEKLHRDITGVLNQKEVRDFFAAQGTDVIADTPEHFGQYVKGEAARWGEVVRASGATAD
jgi:tripartite-type tricarboxylate transporter receptor subunit TctC